MRYLGAFLLSGLVGLSSGCTKQEQIDKPQPVVKEIDVSNELGRVHCWKVNDKTSYIEISWTEEENDIRTKYALSANAGRKFYDIGKIEIEKLSKDGWVVLNSGCWDAESPSAFTELVDLSKKANEIRDSLFTENGIADQPESPPPYFIEVEMPFW